MQVLILTTFFILNFSFYIPLNLNLSPNLSYLQGSK